MTRIDPIRALALVVMLAWCAFVWIWLATMFWPTVQSAIDAAGLLTGCEGAPAAECVAYAETRP